MAVSPDLILLDSELFAKGGGSMHKRILVPLDGSVPAAAEMPSAQEEAMLTRAELAFLGVLVNSAPGHFFLDTALTPRLVEDREVGTDTKKQGGIQRFRNLLLMCESSEAEPGWRSQTRR
jgi:hypothetical protein